MFDDLETATKESDGEKKSSVTMERWAHFPAMAVFGILFLLFHASPWRWYVAIAGGYTIYVFWFALGTGKSDLDDILGDTQNFRYISKLLLPHIFILVLILFGASFWFRAKPFLPSWVTHEGRKESLWDFFGWLVLAGAGISQGFWMAARIKREYGKPGESD